MVSVRHEYVHLSIRIHAQSKLITGVKIVIMRLWVWPRRSLMTHLSSCFVVMAQMNQMVLKNECLNDFQT